MTVLAGDKAVIQGCIDSLRGKYKRLLFMRHPGRYSWARIAVEMGVPDTTARRWYGKAVERLGEALADVPMVEEILGRASCARV